MELDRSREGRGAASLERGLALLDLILEDGGARRLADLSARTGMPISTAQRLAAAFVRQGLLCRIGPGRYAPGVRLTRVVGACDWRTVLADAARPLVEGLARQVAATAHFGVLDGGMVTYLVKAHGGGAPVLTSENTQLEAYCSGIGKALLAHQSPTEQDDYLAGGPFVALTDKTTTKPDALRSLFQQIRTRGYAVDDAELQPGLYCLAAPIHGARGAVTCAISISKLADAPIGLDLLPPLMDCARRIGRRLGASA